VWRGFEVISFSWNCTYSGGMADPAQAADARTYKRSRALAH
jgi:hypothetical protein